jgi:hypothetical protein
MIELKRIKAVKANIHPPKWRQKMKQAPLPPHSL